MRTPARDRLHQQPGPAERWVRLWRDRADGFVRHLRRRDVAQACKWTRGGVCRLPRPANDSMRKSIVLMGMGEPPCITTP